MGFLLALINKSIYYHLTFRLYVQVLTEYEYFKYACVTCILCATERKFVRIYGALQIKIIIIMLLSCRRDLPLVQCGPVDRCSLAPESLRRLVSCRLQEKTSVNLQ